MSRIAVIVKILIASPSDTQEERTKIPEFISEWNTMHSEKYGIYLEAIEWETHATTQLGSSAQELINVELVSKSDILIGTFWTKIGTKTDNAKSGTIEEIEQFIESGKPVSLYFSHKKEDPSDIDHTQFQELLSFKEKIRAKGLVRDYSSIEELKTHFMRDITKHVDEGGFVSSLNQAPRTYDSLKEFAIKFRVFTDRLKIDVKLLQSAAGYSSDLKTVIDPAIERIWGLYTDSVLIGNRDVSIQIFSCAEKLTALRAKYIPVKNGTSMFGMVMVGSGVFGFIPEFSEILSDLEKINSQLC